MLLILDSSAILSGIPLQGKMMTSPAIEAEFSPGGHSWRMFQYLKKAGLLIISPSDESRRIIEETSGQTGDNVRLSEADTEILALAYEHRSGGLLLSDDYSIQNVARKLNIRYSPLSQRGIRKIVHWGYQCSGCGRSDTQGGECVICGSPMKMVRKK